MIWLWTFFSLASDKQNENWTVSIFWPNKQNNIWATAWENVHSDVCIHVFIVSMKKLCIIGYNKCTQWRFWSDCVNAQADLNLHYAYVSEGLFTDTEAHLYYLVSDK